MKKTTCKLIGYTLIALCILASCDADGHRPFDPYVRGIDPGWGYMHGTVERPLTGEKILINHVQDPNLKSLQGHRASSEYSSYLGKMVRSRHIGFVLPDSKWEGKGEEDMLTTSLILNLVNDFRDGIFEIIYPEQALRDDDGNFIDYHYEHNLSIAMRDNTRQRIHWFVPDKNEPFLLHMDIVEFSTWNAFSPLIEGRLEGVLYREDNPEDYMVVDISFGI